MSIFNPVNVTCPHCSKEVDFQASASVNADRRPDLRSAILEGSFQRENCRHCGEHFRAEPQLNYLDVGRGQWFAAFPLEWVDKWPDLENTATEAFSKAFGAHTSGVAREIGDSLKPRMVFGWLALAEKLRAAEAGLNDTTLELVKLALMRGMEDPLEIGQQLRLIGSDEENLQFLIVGRDGFPGEAPEELTVPRGLYDDITAEPEDWQPLRDKLSAGYFVDIARMIRGPAEEAGAEPEPAGSLH